MHRDGLSSDQNHSASRNQADFGPARVPAYLQHAPTITNRRINPVDRTSPCGGMELWIGPLGRM